MPGNSLDPKTSVSELFAILRQWVPQVQQNIDVIGNEVSSFYIINLMLLGVVNYKIFPPHWNEKVVIKGQPLKMLMLVLCISGFFTKSD